MKDKIVILVLLVVVVGMCVALGISLNKKCPTLPPAPVPDTYVDGSDETINSLFDVLTDENASITDMDHAFIDSEIFTNNKVTVNDLSDVDLFNIIVDKIIRENGNNYQVNISGDKILQDIKDYFGEKVRFTNQTYDTCPKYEFNTATSTYEYRTSDCSRGNYDSYVLKRVVMGKQSSDDLKIYVRCIFVKNNNGALSFGTTAGNFGNLTDYERVGDSFALTMNNFRKGTLYEITYSIKDNRYVFDSINDSKG